MFDRFLRHIHERHASVATFDAAHIESFFSDVGSRTTPGTTTRLRYGTLLDRVCRHLVDIGLRASNPASEVCAFARWPEDEPLPLYLDQAADERLQAWTTPSGLDDSRTLRNRAIVALFLGTGISAAELRQAHRRHVVVDGTRPDVFIPKRGARDQRRVTLPQFALPALRQWTDILPSADDALLFPAPGKGGVMNDVLLGTVVKDALEGIGYVAPDMSPRILRNTFARRQLLSGRSNEDTTAMLGLVSQRTVVRLRATISEAGSS